MYLIGTTRPRWWRWVFCALFVAIWTLLGLFEASHTCIVKAYRGEAVDLPRSLALNLALWYAWAPLALLAIAFASGFPIRLNNWWHRLPLALAVAVLLALVKIVPDYPIIRGLYCPTPELLTFPIFYRMGFASHFTQYFFFAVGMLGVIYAWNYFRDAQQSEVDSWQLEARLAQARLQVLRMQLHPHFLFNTLNTVSHLIQSDPDEAERVLARLGDLLRLMLDTAGEQEVPLRQEIEFLRGYLEIERARFGPGLDVRLDIEPGLLEAAVPPLILQPLVENAVLYGTARLGRTGRVEIRARRAGEKLRLEVWDDGPGLGTLPSAGSGKGIGLANTRARLAQLYNGRSHFEIRNAPVGVLAVMEFPLSDPAAVVHLPCRAIPRAGCQPEPHQV
jgi:signal transduction histidine kinase